MCMCVGLCKITCRCKWKSKDVKGPPGVQVPGIVSHLPWMKEMNFDLFSPEFSIITDHLADCILHLSIRNSFITIFLFLLISYDNEESFQLFNVNHFYSLFMPILILLVDLRRTWYVEEGSSGVWGQPDLYETQLINQRK